MTKKEIARLVYNSTQLSLVDSQEAVQVTFEAITKLLVKYGRVELRGFGVFKVQTRASRKAHNPRTGDEVQVPEHETVVFKPSKLMKVEVQNRSSKRVRAKKSAKPAAAPKAAAKAVEVAKATKATKAVEKVSAPTKPAAKKCGRKAK